MIVDQVERQRQDSQVAAKLRSTGVSVSSVFDLVNTGRSYRAAIPALLESLQETSDSWIKQGIVRALTIPEARGVASHVLLGEFRRQPTGGEGKPAAESLKWAIANALALTATANDFDQLVELLRDGRHGKAREMLALALANTGVPAAVGILCGALADPEIAGHSLLALNKIRANCDPRLVAELEHDKRGWVRREARRMLRRKAAG